jgi:serine/threonine-protein kinase SRPK3
LSAANIAFTASQLSESTKADLFEVLGQPKTEVLSRYDGKPLEKSLPRHLVKVTNWDDWFDEDEEVIRILDFGQAFSQGQVPKSLAQPGDLQVPETFFTKTFTCEVDLWRAGMVVRTIWSQS